MTVTEEVPDATVTGPSGLPAAAGVTQDLGDGVLRTVLPGGLRVVTERLPAVRSVAYGLWVDVGARDETPELGGVSHFLEHLLFKGTRRRDAREIANAVDAVGGEMNAWTGQEQTCYYARVLDTDLALAADVVTDMVTDSLIRAEDVLSERTVVLEEIAMRDDEPADAVSELLSATVYGDHPLGRPIAGTPATMTAMTRDQVFEYWREWYQPYRSVVTAAGNVDHDHVVEVAASVYGSLGLLANDHPPGGLRADRGGPVPVLGVDAVREREIEQANVLIATQGLPLRDPRRYAQTVLSTLLGGGMSSRLFQEVRERRGLAYSVHTVTESFADVGTFGVYAGCAPSRLAALLDVVHAELASVAAGGVTDEEVARAKGQVKGGLTIGLEDTGSRMMRLGKGELAYGEMPSLAELLDRIEAVTPEDVRALAADLLGRPRTLALLGPSGSAPKNLDRYVTV